MFCEVSGYVEVLEFFDILMAFQRGPVKNPSLIGKQGNIKQIGGDFIFGPGQWPTSHISYFCLPTIPQAIVASLHPGCSIQKTVSALFKCTNSQGTETVPDVEIAELMQAAGVVFGDN